jgi:hypothetical protein
MKQILIEKYIKPSDVTISGDYVAERWLNKNYYLHSFLGQPAYIWYKNGKILKKEWRKKGELHRDRNLPSYIYYYKNLTTSEHWFKNGKETKKIWR